jgi:two-component system response regulator HydG
MAKSEASILIVDDDPAVRTAAQMFLKQMFTVVVTCSKPEQIPGLMKEIRFDVILLDMNFSPGRNDGSEGIQWLGKILELDPAAVVVFITAFGDVDLAVSAMRSGAFDFIVKPWESEKLLGVVRTALQLKESRRTTEKLKERQDILLSDLDQHSGLIIGESLAMEKVLRTIEKVADTDANILLMGENGTGKEVVAREIHRRSGRKNEAFIGVDLGTIPESLFESELFGHTRGAFTDAGKEKAGRFEVAAGGTLFLDEIGNLGLQMQIKLLKVLEERQITRVGSNLPRAIDIRLISATNQPLYEMTRSKEFREDLLYRINTVEIRIPPLRERTGDIPLLAEHFIRLYSQKYQKPGVRISRSTYLRLENYPWPGNTRELRHAIERAVILSEGKSLDFTDLFRHYSPDVRSDSRSDLNLQEMERRFILKAISRNHGNMTRAAADLGIARAALYRRLQKHGL